MKSFAYWPDTPASARADCVRGYTIRMGVPFSLIAMVASVILVPIVLPVYG
jgi:hypothetical protein